MDGKISWWKRKELWGTILTAISYSPEIIGSFVDIGIIPEYTLAAKLVMPLGILLTIFGLRKGYKSDNLSSGLTKMLDKIPDEYTGTKGSIK